MTASKLTPFTTFIAAERKKKTPYRKLAALLREKGITIDPSSIHDFVKVRSRPPRQVYTMLEPVSQKREEPPSGDQCESAAPEPPAVMSQLEAIKRLKNGKHVPRNREKGIPSFRPDAPLERLDDAEARRRRDKLRG